MKIYNTDIEDIFFAGDIHGKWDTINTTINHHNLENCCIIVCGDIGIGFESEEFYKQTFNHLTKTLKKKNIHLYLFRGNHDCKDYFDGEHFSEFEYINVIPDYSVIKTPSRNVLCIGGATSIDRYMRINTNMINEMNYRKYHQNDTSEEVNRKCRKVYWENEPLVYDEKELQQLTDNNITIDTVCTHTCPSFCHPISKEGIKSWLEMDKGLAEDLDAERYVCDLIMNYLLEHGHNIQNWYYGHFHTHNVEIIDGIKFTLLDMTRGEKMDIV